MQETLCDVHAFFNYESSKGVNDQVTFFNRGCSIIEKDLNNNAIDYGV